MLCAPVVAELQNEGDWIFYIGDDILARTDVKINGHGDRDAWNIQRVHVPASLDRVDVQFDVTWGPDTKLTITREYTDMLRKKYPGMEPIIHADGSTDTYDVDSGGLIPKIVMNHDGRKYYLIKIHEHLAKRGLAHAKPGKTHGISGNEIFYERFVSG
jgi:hypothetical protein